MTITTAQRPQSPLPEKKPGWIPVEASKDAKNPVVESAEFALKKTNLVRIDQDGVKAAARYIHERMNIEAYTPRTWRTHALHVCPSEPYDPSSPDTHAALNWIFLVSALNFSVWSELEGREDRFGVDWRAGWGSDKRVVWTGYWSLVAALNRALEEGIPITDPTFYASEDECPDSLIEDVFRPAPQCAETVPLLHERIAVMREVGSILCTRFNGSFSGFLDAFQRQHPHGTALQLVQMITETFPAFRDETTLDGRPVVFWKRAQILVAETWAAFFPSPSSGEPHPFFPHGVGQLTMFADYRVPQILHHLCILDYPPSLLRLLRDGAPIAHGQGRSIIAVEHVAKEIRQLCAENGDTKDGDVSSVLIDFYLWDLAKRIEGGEECVEGMQTQDIVPAHRTRSIWY
ncbi:hypothetical protein OF83DRAFT_1278438 [Amylostereum chailletii]|nr:hypothetical protein OF83DRAFT_1278438 [Amylostereum chailletii]